MVRNELEVNENKRLIEKQQKLDSIIETLKLQGFDLIILSLAFK
jgi:hypothetical protein